MLSSFSSHALKTISPSFVGATGNLKNVILCLLLPPTLKQTANLTERSVEVSGIYQCCPRYAFMTPEVKTEVRKEGRSYIP